jgi:hypothetical protein
MFAAPQGVNPPTSVTGLSGWRLRVTWAEPTSRTGMINQYIIAAYNLDKPNLDPVTATFNNSFLARKSFLLVSVFPLCVCRSLSLFLSVVSVSCCQ